jgi:hypothetical protein
MPEFHDREKDHQEWKRAVLSGELELERIDIEAHGFRRPKLPDNASIAEGAAGS